MQDIVTEEDFVGLVEKARWGNSPFCPRCDSYVVRQVKNKVGGRNKRFLWYCYNCKRQFTVRIGTETENSKLPLSVWVYAIIEKTNAFQLHKQTGISYKAAYYLMQVIEQPEIHIGLKELTKKGEIKRLSYSKYKLLTA